MEQLSDAVRRLDREHQETRLSVSRLMLQMEGHDETLADMHDDTKQIRGAMDLLVYAEERRKARDSVYDRLWQAIPILAILLGGLYWLIEHAVPPSSNQEMHTNGAAIYSPSDAGNSDRDVQSSSGGLGTPNR